METEHGHGTTPHARDRPAAPGSPRRTGPPLGRDAALPVDPDLAPAEQLRGRARARHLRRRTGAAVRSRWDILLVIAAGGALGAGARYGLGVAWPHRPGQFPWATFTVNVTGCLALGVLMVFVTDVWSASRYLRPFLGVGLLGGYTTFSTYALETRDLVAGGHQQTAGAYLLASLAAGLGAVWVGILTGRLTLSGATRLARRRARGRPPESAPPPPGTRPTRTPRRRR